MDTETQYIRIGVGTPNPSPMPMPPQGTAFFFGVGTGYLLVRTMPAPRADEIRDHEEARLEMRARAYDALVHICFRFGARWCGDVMPTGQEMPDLPEECEPGKGAVITSLLVDSDTGLIAAMRISSFSQWMSNYLAGAFALNKRFDRETYLRQATRAQTQPVEWHAARAVETMVWPGVGP